MAAGKRFFFALSAVVLLVTGCTGRWSAQERRIIAVQRFDKSGEPFEVYPDIRITAFHGEAVPGPEALRGYSVHPEHVAVADGRVRPFTFGRYCIDFED